MANLRQTKLKAAWSDARHFDFTPVNELAESRITNKNTEISRIRENNPQATETLNRMEKKTHAKFKRPPPEGFEPSGPEW